MDLLQLYQVYYRNLQGQVILFINFMLNLNEFFATTCDVHAGLGLKFGVTKVLPHVKNNLQVASGR